MRLIQVESRLQEECVQARAGLALEESIGISDRDVAGGWFLGERYS
jgi:hypothetical protein